MKVVVSDTTPLNYLILIGEIAVLPALFEKVFIPPAVIEELKHPRAPAVVSEWATNLPVWVEVRSPEAEVEEWIGKGENEAIALALELPESMLLVDDRKAKRAAESRGLPTLGTITMLDFADEAVLQISKSPRNGCRPPISTSSSREWMRHWPRSAPAIAPDAILTASFHAISSENAPIRHLTFRGC